MEKESNNACSHCGRNLHTRKEYEQEMYEWCDNSEEAPEVTVKKYLTVQKEGEM